MKAFLLLCLLFTQTTLACNPVLHLNKGAVAPCEGYIFSLPAELDNRKSLEEFKYLKLVNENNIKLINLKDTQVSLLSSQVKLWQDQSTTLSKQLVDRENSSFWHNTLYFVLGAAVTTGLAFAVNKATK